MSDAHFRLLDWDSQWFGIPIGRADITDITDSSARNIDAWARAQGLKCVYVLTENTQQSMKLPAGYKKMGIRVEYELNPRALATGPSDQVFFMRREEQESVCTLARQLFNDTRFSQDAMFPRERVSELYAEWVRRDSATLNPGCLVVRRGRDITGFITGQRNPADAARGTIGLLGVMPTLRGNGLGRLLLDHMCRAFCENDIKRVTVVTQESNLAACHLYEDGGIVISRGTWYHRWYGESPDDNKGYKNGI